jgi:type III restriction enzyme
MIDEAHRGVEKEGEANTIIGRIISEVPIVYGISATEEKFVNWMDRKRRVMPINVSITDVRNAGIIKENLIFNDTVDGKQAHITLIKDAVRQTIEFEKSWAKYCADEGIETIYPLMVVQVEDSGSDPETQSVFAYDIDLYIKGILEEWSSLTDDNIVHTFSEHKDLEVKGLSGGKRLVKYMQPDIIDASTNVRVVLAKTAIATGWDCPRAEVLVSFRSVSDEPISPS